MAKTEQTKWAKAEAAVEQVDTGDILNPLRRVQQQYLDRADKVAKRGVSSLEEDKRNERTPRGHTKRPLPVKTSGADFYYEVALNVGRLLKTQVKTQEAIENAIADCRLAGLPKPEFEERGKHERCI